MTDGRTWSAQKTLKFHFADVTFTDLLSCSAVRPSEQNEDKGTTAFYRNVGTLEPSDTGSHPGPLKLATEPLC